MKVKPDTKVALNPFTGEFDLSSGNNFSYKSVPTDKTLLLRENDQMIVYEEFLVDGELILEGDLVVVS